MKNKYIKENIVKIILFIFAFISVITTAAIVVSLFTESIPFFSGERLKQLFSYGELWDPRGGKYYVLPLVVGTMMIVVFSCLFAIPLGLGSAIYLSEYASPKTRNILKPVLEILAGIPSVVYGFFALFYITPFLKNNISWLAKVALIFLVLFSLYMMIKCVKGFIDKDLISTKIILGILFLIFLTLFLYLVVNFVGFFKETSNLRVDTFNVLSSSFAVGIMITPLVASISEDALKAVPKTMREGSLGLGATKFETVWNVTIPAAISGIVSSFILAISRAVGETMVVAMAAGAKPVLNFNPLGQVQTMTGYMVNKSFGEVMVGSLEFQTIFVVGLILFFMTFLLNVIAKTVVLKFREEY
ncbi:PstC family ABC transporter permease [Sebaldella sp. S0638]|uniref:PstC family ABC transporter permease n=1 Tax=Sebaldella sp. S0638 TaxID=2957809 RepID=UPI00209F6E52|nr:PstC family ABC transporter permease [Sebaldella sp. S0638]MCP1223637.1 phosphate ABC transporter permease subunit PstC [Sebaldella sp. S0638]